ncbi:AlpA family phage regulatory protein [Enterobacter hormaechei]|uniref:helix-turn-helix transcriptional regulator n=1 Tax=Klebsiella TaxID=570 RepID=UPI002966F9C7|nr:AlpA family phage regulatory protein [Klebsiella michiganensis]EKM8121281.1 AlpA family phage regulatory protein [Enterobacter hormaechei]HBY4049345.1 AlpA family phage regulatory protein [Klebsiella pneumoniae]EKM8121911.1 AlpA family phage regulatory protein [Enterobacter hormaechei]MDW3072412.1 AlpA family phage regulatory protein [Klebsiella michiganensis]MDW3133014.1 AlpA family phage regulatory protein [Klebsiella michiganensis]
MSHIHQASQKKNYVNPVKMLRIKDVMEKLSIARATIYDWLNDKSPRYDPTFPIQRRLGTKSVGWLESELDDWLNNRPISD